LGVAQSLNPARLGSIPNIMGTGVAVRSASIVSARGTRSAATVSATLEPE